MKRRRLKCISDGLTGIYKPSATRRLSGYFGSRYDTEALDAWGPSRASHMRGEHFMQRALLRDMWRKASHIDDVLEFAIEVDALVLHLLLDMREEESLLLDPDTQRDDVVAIDQTCG